LDGIIYISGASSTNRNYLQCSSMQGGTVSVQYCDYTNGDCTPNKECTAASNNIRCRLADITFTKPEGSTDPNVCQNTNNCTYKVKVKFTIVSGSSYPSGCKIGG
jgi:hypothetical protein